MFVEAGQCYTRCRVASLFCTRNNIALRRGGIAPNTHNTDFCTDSRVVEVATTRCEGMSPLPWIFGNKCLIDPGCFRCIYYSSLHTLHWKQCADKHLLLSASKPVPSGCLDLLLASRTLRRRRSSASHSKCYLDIFIVAPLIMTFRKSVVAMATLAKYL